MSLCLSFLLKLQNEIPQEKIKYPYDRLKEKKPFVWKCKLAAMSLSPTSMEADYQNLENLSSDFSFKKTSLVTQS